MSELALSRRSFIKLGAGATAGVIAGEGLEPLSRKINGTVEKITGHPAGNANAVRLNREIVESCEAFANQHDCIQEQIERYAHPSNKFDFVVTGPLKEEIVFRGVNSWNLSRFEHRKNPLKDVFIGTGGINMNRREWIVGALSSVLFGGAHNITSTGIDTEVIPASQTFAGMVFWYLQRKLGLAANTIAHSMLNYRSID